MIELLDWLKFHPHELQCIAAMILGSDFVFRRTTGEMGCLYVENESINSFPPKENGRHFGRQHFQMHFLK